MVVMVKNGHCLVGNRTQILLYVRNKLINWADFMHAEINLGKLKSYFINYWVGMVKNVCPIWSWDSKISCNLRMIWWIELIDSFLHIGKFAINFGWNANLLCIFYFQILVVHCSWACSNLSFYVINMVIYIFFIQCFM